MKLKTTALLVGSVFAATANASSFFITVGDDFNGDGDMQTANIDELGYTGTLATSFYADPTLSIGSAVVDTNIKSVMDGLGYQDGATTNVLGTNIKAVDTDGNFTIDYTHKYTTKYTETNIDTLNSITGHPAEYYETFLPPTTWSLSYQFKLDGEFTATGVKYTGGYIDLFYNAPITGLDTLDDEGLAGVYQTQVARVNVDSSSLSAANLYVYGNVSFDFNGDGIDDAAGNSLIENFFTDVETGATYYDLWKEGDGSAIKFALDTNVNPPVPNALQLTYTYDLAGNITGVARQSTLDGSATMSVPEPGSLILIGAGLLGLGMSTRKRKA